MKTKYFNRELIYTASITLLLLACSRSETSNRVAPLTQAQQESLKQADALTERGYDEKLKGENRGALELFEKAHTLIAGISPKQPEVLASNLDDRATIHLRTGNYSEARKLYSEAEAILESARIEDTKLYRGIKRRLDLLDAFESQGITCTEPLQPQTSSDAGPTEPYFPDLDQMHSVFELLKNDLVGCVARPQGSVTIGLVITGDGRIVTAETRGPLAGSPEGACLEKKLLELSARYRSKFPHFRACFRNFSYPFAIPKAPQ